MVYYKLLDELNHNEVIKNDNGEKYRYSFGAEKWIPTGIMIRYMWPDDIKFGEYVKISEQEAQELLEQKRKQLNALLSLAISTAKKAHEGQVDKGGHPYFIHVQTVAESLDDTEQKIVGYLHDIVEDTHVTLKDLEKLGFTYRIVNSIRIMTQDNFPSRKKYLETVKVDNNACAVKMADLKHNMDISRIPNPTEKDFKRIQKYKKELAFLKADPE